MYRKLPRNMILAGLWFAAEKPPMQTFLKPVCNMLLDIESEGIIYTCRMSGLDYA